MMTDINLTAEQFKKLKVAYSLKDPLEKFSALLGKHFAKWTEEEKDAVKRGSFDGSFYNAFIDIPEPFQSIMNIQLPEGLDWGKPFDTPYQCGFLIGLMMQLETSCEMGG
jgi:hypothetical protein